MQKKIIIQIGLFLFTVFIIFITFKIYFNNNVISNKLKNNETIISKNENANNLIKDIYYISSDKAGNVYEIMSKTGEIDSKNPSIIYMTNVTAKFMFADKTPLNITSKYAEYNNENYETTFTENVLVRYVDHEIKAERMRLSMEENLATMSKDVFYNNSDVELVADKVEIDLLTKDSKIFMDNKYKKVEITGKAKNGNY